MDLVCLLGLPIRRRSTASFVARFFLASLYCRLRIFRLLRSTSTDQYTEQTGEAAASERRGVAHGLGNGMGGIGTNMCNKWRSVGMLAGCSFGCGPSPIDQPSAFSQINPNRAADLM